MRDCAQFKKASLQLIVDGKRFSWGLSALISPTLIRGFSVPWMPILLFGTPLTFRSR